ncbi:hypothetical protein P3TCK_19335 [Photobacterium profundum 3TCK]|uniref:Bacterial surface antigen (D15) domain-containing protein n=2 Tax=Photobacterium profundum TaxID=74109 RepID=Q1YZG8_9GAMM|nr:hypothetical protein P3TCK_19335 [Photobacterium profundum 3TCK]
MDIMENTFALYNLKKISLTFFVFSTIATSQSNASEYITEKTHNHNQKQSSWVVLPYIFSSDSMGLTTGAVGIFDGYIQPQMTMVATVFVGEELDVTSEVDGDNKEERTAGAMFALSGYKPPLTDRVFITMLGAYAYYPNQRLYLDGSNDSIRDLESNDPKNTSPLQTQGYSNWFEADFRYVLPLGESTDNALPIIQLDRGIAVNRDNVGGGTPFSTGQTILGTELFYSKWTADKFAEEPVINTNGIRFYLEHDNTDYPANPARGYHFNAQFSVDLGIGNSTQSWNAIELDYAHYIELNDFSWTRQNVIAFNVWSAYSPSWDQSESLQEGGGVLDKHQTPMWEGARLGGWNKMRAYDSNRFNDKAALYGTVEYRVIPDFNPLRDNKWSPFPIDWFQTVFYIEVGRVAEQYELDSLLSDMKYDVGFSLRALAANVPVRFEMAFGEEGSAMWVMLNQPF